MAPELSELLPSKECSEREKPQSGICDNFPIWLWGVAMIFWLNHFEISKMSQKNSLESLEVIQVNQNPPQLIQLTRHRKAPLDAPRRKSSLLRCCALTVPPLKTLCPEESEAFVCTLSASPLWSGLKIRRVVLTAGSAGPDKRSFSRNSLFCSSCFRVNWIARRAFLMAARLALPPLIMPEVVPAETSCTCAMAEPCASSGDRHSYQLPWWLLACRTQADILRKLMLQSK